jgi:hypothetical protein
MRESIILIAILVCAVLFLPLIATVPYLTPTQKQIAVVVVMGTVIITLVYTSFLRY